ncbi:hypothetical protein GF312_02720 [Candidatus Poribacteria bacterium]|nr:hypothetical protein [Candidatus Poribacteria bacterium]
MMRCVMKNFLMYLLVSLFIVLSSVVYGAVDDTMVLALSFDEGQGAVAKDSSKYGFDGSITGAQWTNGKFGKALEFKGAGGDVVVVDDQPELLLLEGGTIMAWAYIMTEAGHGSWPRIVIKSNTNGGTHGYDLLFDRANAYAVRFCVGGECTSYEPVETEAWHHVAVTFDGEIIIPYLDGEPIGEANQLGPSIDTTGIPLHIGNGSAADRDYHGILDEVRIWSRPLSADEINFQMERATGEVLAVSSQNKATTTWAEVKDSHR